jgi:hypothetical protein
MPTSPENLLDYLGSLSIEAETVDHPPLHTVEDSRVLRGDIPGGHTKNLFVKDKKGRLFLLVVGEEAVVDLKRVHEKIAAPRGGSRSALPNSWKRYGASGRARSRRSGRSMTKPARFASSSTRR